MSITRIAVRMAAVQALKGVTLVGDNVLDSEMGSLEVDADGTLRSGEDKPFITVYTDAASTKDNDNTMRAMTVNGATDIVFEAGITAAMTETDPVTDQTKLIGVGTPATDQGLEFHLDMVVRQIGDALTDPENIWGQIYQRFIQRMISVDRARTSGADAGVRLAGHQIKVKVDLMSDPVKGTVKESSALAAFFEAADGVDDAAFQAQIAFMKAQLSVDPADWKGAMQRYGMTRHDADAMLITPVDGAGDNETISEFSGEAAPAS
jgi:hypothetical protein